MSHFVRGFTGRRRESVPGEGLGAVRTDVRLLHAALVRAHVVAHPVFPLEALLADGAGVRLLVGVGQAVAVEVVDVSEGLPAGLAGVVLPHLVGVGTGIGILWRSREVMELRPARQQRKTTSLSISDR